MPSGLEIARSYSTDKKFSADPADSFRDERVVLNAANKVYYMIYAFRTMRRAHPMQMDTRADV